MLAGVALTEVGYTGGTSSRPSYYRMGDHTEVVRVTFHPDLTSLEAVLHHFWSCHDWTARRSAQYRSLIVCSTEEQLQAARPLMEDKHRSSQRRPLTVLMADQTFHLAEEKHQKFYFKRHRALATCFAWETSPTSSFVISRLNGYLGGGGHVAAFNKEWETLGLTRKIAEYVREVIVRRG